MLHRLLSWGTAGMLAFALVLSSAPAAFAAAGADLTVALAGRSHIRSNGTAEFTATVTNLGPETATGAVLGIVGGDQLAINTTTCEGTQSVSAFWTLGQLASGASTTVTFNVKVCWFARNEVRETPLSASVEYANDPDQGNNGLQLVEWISGPHQK